MTTTSRRDLIKKGVVAGGLVWAAPTLVRPASASHGSHCFPAAQCTLRCRAKTSSGTTGCGSFEQGVQCVPAAPASTFECCSKVSIVQNGSTTTITVIDPSCQLLTAFAKQGTACTPMTIANCAVGSYTGPGPSHVEFTLCCRAS